MKVLGVIPARFASTRFPGKPLVNIAGRSMIQRVVEQVQKANAVNHIIVATDDARIHQHVEELGANALMTSPDHPSGTDRCKEALEKAGMSFDLVVNIQGDEPFIEPAQIDLLVSCFNDKNADIATLVRPIESSEELFNPNQVKALIRENGDAIYFSRAAIPHLKEIPQEQWVQHHNFWGHVGLYAYRSEVLKNIAKLPPSPLEKAESLEQLRWLENGYSIKTKVTPEAAFGIDTPEDLEEAIRRLQTR